MMGFTQLRFVPINTVCILYFCMASDMGMLHSGLGLSSVPLEETNLKNITEERHSSHEGENDETSIISQDKKQIQSTSDENASNKKELGFKADPALLSSDHPNTNRPDQLSLNYWRGITAMTEAPVNYLSERNLRESDNLRKVDAVHLLKNSSLNKVQSSLRKLAEEDFRCTSGGFNKNIVNAVLKVIKTLHISNLYFVFQGQPDFCLLERFWSEGIAGQLLQLEPWWMEISKLRYLHHSQHVLVGSVEWIAGAMNKVQFLYEEGSLNSKNTNWIWVASESSSFGEETVPTENPSLSFTYYMERVTQSLQEGMRGVLLAQEESIMHTAIENNDTTLTKKRRLIKIASIEDPGDGSWKLRLAGIWKLGNLQTVKPLWSPLALNFHKRTIRMSVVQEPIVFEYTEGGGLDEAGGYLSELMIITRNRLNFSDVVILTQGYGALEANGSWNGMVGVLHRKEADVAPLDFTPSWPRAQVVQFSYPIGEDLIVILSRAPDVIVRPFLLLQIYSVQSWACLVAAALVTGVALEMLVRAENRISSPLDKNKELANQWSNVLKIFVYQGSCWWPKGSASRLAVAGVMFVAIISGTLYSGSTTAFFAIPFRSKPLDSAADLLSSNVLPVVRSKTVFYKELIADEIGIFHSARERAVAVGSDDISTIPFLQKVADGIYALIDAHHTAVGRAKLYEKSGERCKLYIGKEHVRTDMDILTFRRNSPFSYQIDDTLKWLKYYGIIEQTKKKYYSMPCSTDVRSDVPQPLTLAQVQGAYYATGIGLSLGFVVFLIGLTWSSLFRGMPW